MGVRHKCHTRKDSKTQFQTFIMLAIDRDGIPRPSKRSIDAVRNFPATLGGEKRHQA